MLHIVFEYRDEYSNGKWNRQECECSSLEQCKKFYGLFPGEPVEWRIISVEEISGGDTE